MINVDEKNIFCKSQTGFIPKLEYKVNLSILK